MDLRKYLDRAGITQRELGRRCGYSSNGVVFKALRGTGKIPIDDAPKWADALGLNDAEKAEFFADCAQESVPDWLLAEIAEMRRQLALYKAAFENMAAEQTESDTLKYGAKAALEMAKLRAALRAVRAR